MPLFEDYMEMIKSDTVDMIIIATPHYSHTTIGIEAMRLGMPVMFENPSAFT